MTPNHYTTLHCTLLYLFNLILLLNLTLSQIPQEASTSTLQKKMHSLAAVSGQSQAPTEAGSSLLILLPMGIPFPIQQQEQDGDDDYIDMDLNISSSFNRIRDYRDFEFQMSSSAFQTQTADQLFCNGRLLPLHKINPDSADNALDIDWFKASSTAPATTTSTPLAGSRNVSPLQSCRVSCELNPEEYFFEWSTEIRGFIHNRPNESWSKKMRKSSSLCHKLRSSGWTFIKSLFTKPGVCANESCAKAAAVCNMGPPLKVKDLLYAQYVKVEDRSPCKLSDTIMRSIKRLELRRDVRGSSDNHRRSFSGAIHRRGHPVTNNSGTMNSSSGTSSSSPSSSSSSFSSAGPNDLPLLRSSSSANSELERESSIEGAIAHCKQSQSQHYSPNHPTKAATVTQFGTNLLDIS